MKRVRLMSNILRRKILLERFKNLWHFSSSIEELHFFAIEVELLECCSWNSSEGSFANIAEEMLRLRILLFQVSIFFIHHDEPLQLQNGKCFTWLPGVVNKNRACVLLDMNWEEQLKSSMIVTKLEFFACACFKWFSFSKIMFLNKENLEKSHAWSQESRLRPS